MNFESKIAKASLKANRPEKEFEAETLKLEFNKVQQEKKGNLLTIFLQEHPKLGRRARELAFVLMGITSVLASENSSAQNMRKDSTHQNLIEYSQDTMLSESLEKTLELQLPPETIEIFSSSFNQVNKQDKILLLNNNSKGGLADNGGNLFIITEYRSYTTNTEKNIAEHKEVAMKVVDLKQTVEAQGKPVEVEAQGKDKESAIQSALRSATEIINSKNIDFYKHSKDATVIGETSHSLESTGDTLQVSFEGKTKSEAIASALEEASRQSNTLVKSELVNKISQVEQADSTGWSKQLKKSMLSNVVQKSSTYIYSYRVTSETYNSDDKYYSVTLEVIPGVLKPVADSLAK